MPVTIEHVFPDTHDQAHDGDLLYEVVNGHRVELQPMGAWETGIANLLAGYLWFFLSDRKLGRPFVEMLFRLDAASKLDRRPDVAFVAFERWPGRVVPDVEAWEMIPSLAAEVVSKNNTVVEIDKKIRDCFAHGVSLVWVIHPDARLVYVYEGGEKNISVLDSADTLDGGQVLPGFRLAVGKLFE